MVKMVVLLAEQGSPMMKSKEMWDQGHQGVERGRSRLAGGRLEVLVWARTGQQPQTYKNP